MNERIGDELLFPIYDDTKGGGANFQYHVIGWVGFLVTDFEANGSKGKVVRTVHARALGRNHGPDGPRQRFRCAEDRTRRIAKEKAGRHDVQAEKHRNCTCARARRGPLDHLLRHELQAKRRRRRVGRRRCGWPRRTSRRARPARTSPAAASSRSMEVAKKSVAPGAITSPEQLEGKIAADAHLRGRAADDASLHHHARSRASAPSSPGTSEPSSFRARSTSCWPGRFARATTWTSSARGTCRSPTPATSAASSSARSSC